jgi:ABC-2 type transport system ATP-binding protein
VNTEFIQLKDVVKKFGSNVVLDGVDLSIPEGKITGIIGASGEGKSTVLKLIIGFYRPTKGEVLYLKRSVYEDIGHLHKTFGFATEDGSFYDSLTVIENLHHFGRLYHVHGKELKARAEEVLKFVGLENAAKTKAKNLSVGMKKRLDFACSIMHKPNVLIMDEPTADLDPLLRKQILSLIKSINKEGTTIILTTQLLEEMDTLCDKIAILCERKIVEEGEPGKIKKKYHVSGLNDVFHKIFSKRDRHKISESLEKHHEEHASSSVGHKKHRHKKYNAPDTKANIANKESKNNNAGTKDSSVNDKEAYERFQDSADAGEDES